MNISSWNKETRQSFVGAMLYSIFGVIAAILTPFAVLGTVAKALSGVGTGGLGIALSIVYLFVILGYFIFYLAVKDLRKITEGTERSSFDLIKLSIIISIVGAFFGVLHLNITNGICGLVTCVLLLIAFSSLKNSRVISDFSPSAITGFSILFVAEILILVAICLGWIPVIKIFSAVLKVVAWLLVLLGWKKVSAQIPVPGEQEEEKSMKDIVKDVLVESLGEAKDVARETSSKVRIISEEIAKKSSEAKEEIKEKMDENNK